MTSRTLDHVTRAIATVAILLAVVARDAAADATADELKAEGMKAARNKDWALARDKFQQSYAFDPRPGVLFNLANAQEHTDQLIAARASYQAFLDDTRPGKEFDQFRTIASTRLSKLAGDIPTLTVRLAGPADGVSVELDGKPLAAADLSGPVMLDPGAHTAIARRGGEEVAKQTVTLARGAHEPLELAVPPLPVKKPPVDLTVKNHAPEDHPLPPLSPNKKKEGGGGLLSSGWFWGVTLVVLAGAAGAGYYYVLYDPPSAEPITGTLGVLELP